MMTVETTGPGRPPMLGRRAAIAAIAFAASLGLTLGATSAAQANIGMFYVSSNWFQSFAALTSNGGDGLFQARATLGGTTHWGALSQTNTKAQVDGFSPNHGAVLFRNYRVWQTG